MKCIYLRHGLTPYSVNNCFMGRANLPLLSQDPSSFRNAIQLINSYPVGSVLCSPLLRAKQTFNIIEPYIDLNEYTEDKLLIERDFGLFEGKEKNKKNRALLEEEVSVESVDLFRLRISTFFDSYKSESNFFLIIGHSAFYREAIKLFNLSDKVNIDCCEAVILEFP